jgi:hypothetical protein
MKSVQGCKTITCAGRHARSSKQARTVVIDAHLFKEVTTYENVEGHDS